VVAQEIQYWQPSTKTPDERLSRFDVVPLDLLDHSRRKQFLLPGLFFIGEFREEGDRRGLIGTSTLRARRATVDDSGDESADEIIGCST